MAHFKHDQIAPRNAASAIRDWVPVRADVVKDQVVLCASNNLYPFGLTIASAASPGDSLAVVYQGVAKAVCAASVGAGAEVGVASTNGALGPIAAASGFRRFVVGESTEPAQPGEIFSVQIRVRELTGVAY